MQLTIREAARLLNVPEEVVYKWIGEGALRCHRVDDQHRINRSELLEFATVHRVPISAEMANGKTGHAEAGPSLAEAILRGGVFHGVDASDKRSALAAAVSRMEFLDSGDRDLLLPVLLAREELASTGVGDGIAIPHVRGPIVLKIAEPVVTLCYLSRGVEFGAIDGRAVDVLFMLICPTVRLHLQVLSRLAFCLRQEAFKASVRQRAPLAEIVAQARRQDEALAASADERAGGRRSQ